MKRLISVTFALAIAFALCISASAASPKDTLTPEQKAVIADYANVKGASIEKVNRATVSFGVSPLAITTYRGSLYRGSVLMWSKDFIEWTTNGSTISNSTAWQECGFIFPNIVRLGGISLHNSTSSSVTYRGKKTIGAGVVTPWGDVTVYESDYTDFLRGNANGTFDTW